jgi:cardiolipin synthase
MTHFIGGNKIKLLRSGAEYFPALETAINTAKYEVHLQTYIYQADIIGVRIGHALMQAALRGVNVYMLLDGFGSKDLPKDFIAKLKNAGVQIIFYRPKISPWSLKIRRLRRLHRKVVVIDDQIAFVGGINIIDDYNMPGLIDMAPRIDYAVSIEGRLLPKIIDSVHKLWRRMAWWQQLAATKNVSKTPNKTIEHASNTGVNAAFVLRDNVLHRFDIETAYLNAINNAQHEIIIANAYFVPGKKFRLALLNASKRGVNVKLLLQGRMEYFLMFASQAFYSEFLSNDIEIYEYTKTFMHSKVAVVDNYWATVGSSNIDPFSLLLAREANILVQDTAFSTALRLDILLSIQEGATRVSTADWTKGNFINHTASWIAFGLVRLFLGVIGQENEQQ